MTALLLITGVSFVPVFASLDSQAQVSDNCEEATELAVLTSPIAPWKGAPLRVMFARYELMVSAGFGPAMSPEPNTGVCG